MIGPISSYGYYQSPYLTAPAARGAARSGPMRTAAIPAAQPEVPVQPVTRVPALAATALDRDDIMRRLATDPAAMAVRSRIEYLPDEKAKSAMEVAQEGECQTCKERKYQDGSDDMGVSFQTPTHIAPDAAPATVRGHEYEHVTREQAKADREGREVVSQSVTYHNAICPECGRVYVSGGTTRTVTAAAPEVPSVPEVVDGQSAYPGGFSAVA